MSSAEDVARSELGTTTNGDQPAEAAAQPTEKSDAEQKAGPQPEAIAEQKQSDDKSPSPKAKTTPAKAKVSEPVQSAERPAGRRERKQTAFFQPEKQTETEKLEIKEARNSAHLESLLADVVVLLSSFWLAALQYGSTQTESKYCLLPCSCKADIRCSSSLLSLLAG